MWHNCEFVLIIESSGVGSMRSGESSVLFLLMLAMSVWVVSPACNTANCANCPNDICTQCDDTYYLSGNSTCEHCSDINCRICASDNCSDCKSGYYL